MDLCRLVTVLLTFDRLVFKGGTSGHKLAIAGDGVKRQRGLGCQH